MPERGSLSRWVNAQTGWCDAYDACRSRPVPGGPKWTYSLGAILITLLAFMAVTGCVLALSYSPSSSAAHSSVKFTMEQTPLGGFVRSLHYHGTNFTIAVLILCGFRIVLVGAYRQGREIQWVVGVLAGLSILAISTTGYLLPWDQYGYWGTQVRTSIMGSAPVVGPEVKRIVLGGSEIGNLTLTRFFAGHALIIPAIGLGLLFLYRGLQVRWATSQSVLSSVCVPYWPMQAARDAVASLAVVGALFVTACLHPPKLGYVADAMVTYPARPEWYFLWLFQLLKYFQGPFEVLGTLIIPHLILLLVLAIPFLDRKTEGWGVGRVVVLVFFFGLVTGWIGLSSAALYEDYHSGHFEEVAMWEADPDPHFDAAAFYQAECKNCHGRNGAGFLDTTPDLTASLYWSGVRSEIRLVKGILTGIPDTTIPPEDQMPAFKDKMTPGQAKTMVEYLRTFREE